MDDSKVFVDGTLHLPSESVFAMRAHPCKHRKHLQYLRLTSYHPDSPNSGLDSFFWTVTAEEKRFCISTIRQIRNTDSIICSFFEALNKPVWTSKCTFRTLFTSLQAVMISAFHKDCWSTFVISCLISHLSSTFPLCLCCSYGFPTTLIKYTCCVDAMHCGLDLV